MTANPLAPDPTTDIDGPEVFPLIDPVQEDVGAAVPLEEEDEEVDEPFGEDESSG